METFIRRRMLKSLVTYLVLLLAIETKIHAVASWQWLYPFPQGNDLKAVAHGATNFVAVGTSGTVLTSADAITWQIETSGITNTLNTVAFGNGRYVAAGEKGILLTSEDGHNWVQRSSGTTNGIFDLKYVDNNFIAHTWLSGAFMRSPDGIIWTSQILGGGCCATVSYGGGQYAVGGIDAHLYLSTNGTSWSQSQVNLQPGFRSILGLGYGNGKFVGVGVGLQPHFGFPTTVLVTSTNGRDWTIEYKSSLPVNPFPGLDFKDGTFLAQLAGGLYTYSDAAGFVLQNPNVKNGGMTHSENRWVVVGQSGIILTSDESSNWLMRSQPVIATGLRGVASSGDKLVAVGYPSYSFPGTILTLSNGIVQNVISSEDRFFELNAVIYTREKFVAVGNFNGVAISLDGITWAITNAGTALINATTNIAYVHYQKLAAGKNLLVAIGFDGHNSNIGKLSISTDGLVWDDRPYPDAGIPSSILFANNTFVTSTFEGAVWTSSDATNWNRRLPSSLNGINQIAFGKGRFIGVGNAGGSVYSLDGISWREARLPTTNNLSGIAYGNGIFLASGPGGVVYSSVDGLNWGADWIGTGASLDALAFDGKAFTVVSTGVPLIMKSEDIISLELSSLPGCSSGPTLKLYGPLNRAYKIEQSTNLALWQQFVTLSNTAVEICICDTNLAPAQRFYRARLIP